MQIQQGDVLIETGAIPESAIKRESLVLAEGETTGHKHLLVPDEGAVCEVFEEKGNLYVSVKDGKVRLVHEEHKEQELPVGDYKISIVNEYDYETDRSRHVLD